jgi:hypothetical protein
MSLKIRKEYLKNLSKRFKGKKINDLMYEVNVPKPLFQNIRLTTINYLSKCFNDGETINDEKKLLKKLIFKRTKLSNITPNGMIVPKNEISLEFNNIIKAYVEILKHMNVVNLIKNFHFPPNLRIKYPQVRKSHFSRKHPTELMHADTWTGANPNWCAVHLFILGDISKNHIRYAYPPENFEERWLKPLGSSHEGKNISKEFKVIDYTPKKGSLIIADATIIHQSFRKKNAGIRLSLDTGFDVKMKKLKSFKKTVIGKHDVKKIRDEETISKDDFFNIGKKTYFHFPHSFKQKVYHKGGFKHPTHPKLIRLANK